MQGGPANYVARRWIVGVIAAVALAALVVVILLIARGAQPAGPPIASSPTGTPSASATPSPSSTPAPAPIETPAPPVAQLPPAGTCWGDPVDIGVLVNKLHPLCPLDYVPDLVQVASTGGTLRPEAAEALDAMAAALAAETGTSIYEASSYRSYDTQVSTYGGWVEQDGQDVADTYSARPGHSEHQTGLAIDLAAASCGCTDEPFGHTPEGEWIAANAWRFGWIVRYPDGYQSTTGYIWEPWHVRYIGVDAATAMHDQGIATYEDYLGAGPAPDYVGG